VLLPRPLAEGRRVRRLVHDPRQLSARRVRVQIALGDLADPPSFRNAPRGMHTVVHLAASIHDQPFGSIAIEELNGIATSRIVGRAERLGAERRGARDALSLKKMSIFCGVLFFWCVWCGCGVLGSW